VSTEQEYDAQAEMVDDQDQTESGPGPYPEPIPTTRQQMPNQFQQLGNQGSSQGIQTGGDNSQGYASMTQQLMDPYDPMLDMDPFGLSASM